MSWRGIVYTLFIILITACSVCRQHRDDSLSPRDYGLKKARTGEERYEILYKIHSEALRLGKTVDYSKIKKIDLVIPKGAKSIPLTENTDFKGVTITVKNNSKTFFLFEYTRAMTPITVKAKEVDSRVYSNRELNNGQYLLSITDENPWVENREGFSYGATRKDIVLIENGQGGSGPCSSYTTAASSPKYEYRPVTKSEKSFTNVVFKRLPGSAYLTKLVKFSFENNVRIENISISTPTEKLYGDQAICVYDCTNVLLKNITINGTYSTTEQFGYGISMNNVWNVECHNINSRTAWGVFGTNNTHQVHLKDCNVNRYDIHCYGKDVLCENCVFTGVGGAYSSVFGTIEYRGCTFNEATPYINRPDYNAYVPFDLVMKNCVFNSDKNHYFLINLRSWSDKINKRAELRNKCIPNITIENLKVNITEDISAIELLKLPQTLTYLQPAGNLSSISIKGLSYNYSRGVQPASFRLSSTEVQLASHLTCTLEQLTLLPKGDEAFAQRTKKYDYSGSVEINLIGSRCEEIRIADSRLNYNVTSNSKHSIVFERCSIGCVRMTLNQDASVRRQYNNCEIHLNGCDTDLYFIDNYAEYNNSTIIPASPQIMMAIPAKNRVTFRESKAHPSLLIKDEPSPTKAGGGNSTGIQGLTR